MVLADTEQTWQRMLAEQGRGTSRCWCCSAAGLSLRHWLGGRPSLPADRKGVPRLSFFHDRRQSCPGLCQAYAVAHEVGHHLQHCRHPQQVRDAERTSPPLWSTPCQCVGIAGRLLAGGAIPPTASAACSNRVIWKRPCRRPPSAMTGCRNATAATWCRQLHHGTSAQQVTGSTRLQRRHASVRYLRGRSTLGLWR